MDAPRLRSANPTAPLASVVDGVPVAGAFVVESAGIFRGRRFEVGEVILVGGRARPGHEVVLCANGYGRPRLGSVSDEGLRGDAGELCSRLRWHAAGRLLAVLPAPAPALRVVEVERGPTQLALAWGGREAA